MFRNEYPTRINSSPWWDRVWAQVLRQGISHHQGRLPTTSSGRNSVVECLLPKQMAVGSSPIARSINEQTHCESPALPAECGPTEECLVVVLSFLEDGLRSILPVDGKTSR